MSDVNISKYRAQVIRQGSTPASPGFAVAEGQNPVDPSGSGQTHLPVTIATATTGLSITESQILSGAGLVSQYIRGDGSLADFPATTGGGSSVSYYLNGSVSQGTIGGVAYKQLNRTPVFGAGTDFTIAADGYIASFITDASDPNKLLIPAGNWNFETYFSASSNGGSPSFYVELYKYDGTTFTLIATSSSAPELIAFGTSLNPYYSTLAVPQTALALTDRLAIRYYVTHSGRTITLHTEDNHLCQIITTFTTGLTALNGLTAQVQNFAVGTSGTDFAIASATATHTFNLPTASATNRGALSSADWTTFNNKTSNLGTVTSVGLSSATSGVTIGSTPVTTSGTITLAIATASGSQNGLLSSTDWTTFNGKQNLLTNPVTGTGTTNYLSKFTGASAIGNSQVFDNGTNVGINTNSPLSTNLLGALTIVKSYSSDTPASTTAQTYYTNQSGLYLFGRNSGLTIVGANNEENQIIFANTSTVAFASINTGTGSNSVGGDMYFKVGSNTEAMRIFATTRNLHIGATPASDNGARLQVSGFGTISSGFQISGGPAGYGGAELVLNSVSGVANGIYTNAGGAVGMYFDHRGTSNSGFWVFRNGTDAVSEQVKITSAGNLGIGTNPLYKLDVLSSASDWAVHFKSSTGSQPDVYFADGSTNSGIFINTGNTTSTNNAFLVSNGTNFIFNITNSGNVLIGTATNGASKLRLVGLPTSSAGLSSGDVYSLAGTLMIA